MPADSADSRHSRGVRIQYGGGYRESARVVIYISTKIGGFACLASTWTERRLCYLHRSHFAKLGAGIEHHSTDQRLCDINHLSLAVHLCTCPSIHRSIQFLVVASCQTLQARPNHLHQHAGAISLAQIATKHSRDKSM